MELTHIKYFLEVARTEHVTKSAKTLCIVQPALTHAIHKLEDELGVKLFKTFNIIDFLVNTLHISNFIDK